MELDACLHPCHIDVITHWELRPHTPALAMNVQAKIFLKIITQTAFDRLAQLKTMKFQNNQSDYAIQH